MPSKVVVMTLGVKSAIACGLWVPAGIVYALLALVPAAAQSQPSFTSDWHLFSSVESMLAPDDKGSKALSLGESSLFGSGRLGSRFSYLTELTWRPPKYREDTLIVERLSVQYDLSSNHYAAFGKIHTPVNYWNDTYHHGRIFFPTINRPLTMGNQIPLHEIAIRIGARNLGNKGLFYDVALGSGHNAVASNEPFSDGVRSITLLAGARLSEFLTLQGALFSENMLDHTRLGTHAAAHSSGMSHMAHAEMDAMMHNAKPHAPAVNELRYDIASFSARYDNNRLEALTEVAATRFEGKGKNFGVYQYLGLRVNDRFTAYGYFDGTRVLEAFHFAKGDEYRYGAGVNTFLGSNWALKSELYEWHRNSSSDLMLQFQLTAGF